LRHGRGEFTANATREYGAAVLEDVEQIFDVLPLGLPPLEEVAF